MARWYIIHAYSGFENKVRDAIIAEAERLGLSQLVESVEVPTETVTEVRRGKKIQSERKFFPGYVLVKVNLTDAAYHLVKNTPKVTGFLGSANKPLPVSDAEVARIVGQIQEGVDSPRPMISFDIGENVKVIDGPFQSFNGTVESVDEENKAKGASLLKKIDENYRETRNFIYQTN